MIDMLNRRRRGGSTAGFTLVELLVVIGIIALLISILLPTLGRARKAANNVKCVANLRSIVQGMQIYAAQNNGAFPGGPHTSARYVYRDPAVVPPVFNTAITGNVTAIVTIFDWMSPIARIMGIRFEEGGTDAQRVERFVQLRARPEFTCPENQFIARPFGAPNFPVGPMVSYNSPLVFHLIHNPTGSNPGGVVGVTIGRTDWNPPQGYTPRITKVGNPAQKVYIADGARYSNSGTAPDASLAVTGSLGGPFADQGAPMRFSNSWDRSHVPGNAPHPQTPGSIDARLYAFRHGQIRAGAPGDSYRINLGFFDGHVETLGDLEASNPVFWFPKGTSLAANPTQMHNDVMRRYFNNQAQVWIVP